MPRIFDNIEAHLSETLKEILALACRADFCVGYFNLRGWREIDAQIEKFSGLDGACCRLLVGMPVSPVDELRSALSPENEKRLDQGESVRLSKKLASSFKDQLCFGLPTRDDELGLRRLLRQLKAGKVIVKLFLRHPLHAKLYLAFRSDPINPVIGFLGSSNLTFSGLEKQGELNIDVLDRDAADKLARWFEDRWSDRFCVDITADLVKIIEESWARQNLVPPYHIYLKIAYTLSLEARTGIAEEVLPEKFEKILFPFQKEAVKIAAHHLKKRGGILIGDVVGLGKTITATAVASLFDHQWRILVICPKNLVGMWKDYAHEYAVQMEVLSITMARDLSKMRRYQLVIIDESHNLRNRDGQRYQMIRDYIAQNDARVIMLSATPYNKTYMDLANQLRLFLDENSDLGVAPEVLIRENGELFLSKLECQPRTLKAFEHSVYADDWRELMRLFLVRRTRTFIKDNYSHYDAEKDRKYLLYSSGERSYFPTRIPRTLKFSIDEKNPDDQYARLYSDKVVKPVSKLQLPRYGLGNYVEPSKNEPPTPAEEKIIENLSRAGKRLMGFCRTGLFKRLESSGNVFIQSLARHILRNYIYIHALETSQPLPIGPQDVELLDSRITDEDEDLEFGERQVDVALRTPEDFRRRSAEIYGFYRKNAENRFQWMGARHFIKELAADLEKDAQALLRILKDEGDWSPEKDEKLKILRELVSEKHPKDKILVFTQYADTARYIYENLKEAGIEKIASVTGNDDNPTAYAYRFSPHSNKKDKEIAKEDEIRVLIATDVLSEGQNLQDAHIIVNYDLPWAIIRLIQRAGRIDRIGQKHESIVCYSFLPADGVERIIRLRSRVKDRLTQNAEVVGSDEAFFEDQCSGNKLRDLYNEKAQVLEEEDDGEVDLSSEAYQIWKNAVDADPSLEEIVPNLPNVVFSSRPWEASPDMPEGVLVFVKTAQDNCALAWMGNDGKSVTESQYKILRAARCEPDTPALERAENHHELVKSGVELMISENRTAIGGALGSSRGIRFKTYEKLKLYLDDVDNELFATDELRKALQQIYDSPLTEKARNILGQHLKQRSSNQALAEVIQALYEENELCGEVHESSGKDVRLICSLGLQRKKT